ncbi:MAG: hypothetical protein JST00_19145 [Deltaproteobacteria bacterium]|nr:hypothetical protein [Deltaproteobacteria bacterium]
MLSRVVVLASVAGVLAITSLACSGTDGAQTEASIDPTTGQPVDTSPPDGTKNGDETDVDCGGSRVEKCADGKGCVKGGDCQSGVCKQSTCAAPGPDDGIKNADETDVDCGGAKAPKCSVGKSCSKHDDCGSDACSYAKKCVEAKGCTAHAGGDTCGEGESGTAGAKHESCCTTVPIPDYPGGAIEMDKFHVTAGRMRAMIERYDGNLQAWAATSPKGWEDAWTSKLPTNMSEALYLLGPGEKQGCNVASQGGRTYWQDAIDGNTAEKSDFSKDVLDEKALNCVPWHLAQAVCHWDGGRLASAAEIAHVFENRGRAGGKTNYPWEWKGGAAAYNPSVADIRLVHVNSYQTPNPPAAMRLVNGQYPLDHAFWIAPPGRRPTGANMHGVQDIAGNLLHWVDDGQRNIVSTFSWERHGKSLTASTYDNRYTLGYYAIGARCVKQ